MSFPKTLRCVLAAVLAAIGTFTRADVYVSTAGDDSHSGAKDQPVRTLRQARELVRRQIKQAGSSRVPITVWIAGGTYHVERSFELSGEDSGVKDATVSYRAEPGAEVRLSGGRQIPAEVFKPVQDAAVVNRLDGAARGHVLQADLKALGIADFGGIVPDGKRGELFFNDQPLMLARWPNRGFVKIVEVTGGQPVDVRGTVGDRIGKFSYEGDRPGRWVGEKDVWLHGYWFWDWAEQHQKVESIDAKTRTITLAQPYHHYGYRKGQQYYAVNLLAELDLPGEWYLDRRAGLLYVWPPSPMEKARVVFSTLESPVVQFNGVSHVTLRDLTVEAARGDGIRIEGGEDNLIAGCTVRNVGASAVVVHGGKRNGVVACDVYQVNAGIRLSGGDRRTLTPAGHYATNNHIHHFSRLQRTYMPAIELQGVGNRADHNLVHDSPHWAVSFNGNENVMELNELYDVCQETGDVGVFYTGRDWTVRGNVIRHNFIHHVSGPGMCGAQGVYLDDNASGTIVFGNVIYKTMRAMLIGGGRDNRIENNLMLDCNESVCFDNRGLNWAKDHIVAGGTMPQRLAEVPYRQPPWSQRYPQLLNVLQDDPGSPKGNVIRLNVVWRCKPMALAKEVVQFGTIADNLTTDEDLGFQDARKMDFRLRDDSAVFKKLSKFQKIPFEKIGLYVDEYRKSLPANTAQTQQPATPELQHVRYRGIRTSDPGGRDPLRNPERGLRLEERIATGDDRCLINDAQRTQVHGVTLAQSYCYLTDFTTADVSDAKLAQLQASFDALRRLGVKAVLRFAYETTHTIGSPGSKGATLPVIRNHIKQLKPLLEKNADVIFVLQAGFIGAWGEWHSSAHKLEADPQAKAAIVADLLAALPANRMIQLRMPGYKRGALGKDARVTAATAFDGSPAARVGFHIDYFILNGNPWSDVNPGTEDFAQMVQESPFVPVDGEAPWGKEDPHRIDGFAAIERLRDHHYSSFSLIHNFAIYEDSKEEFSFEKWMKTPLGAEHVRRKNLPLSDGYFFDANDHEVPRNVFEYIRDHLGYRLELQTAAFPRRIRAGQPLKIGASLINRGFATLYNPRPALFVLIAPDGRIVEMPTGADPRRWQPTDPGDALHRPIPHELTAERILPRDMSPGVYRLGLWLPDGSASLRQRAAYAIRLANRDVPWWTLDHDRYGINVLGEIEVLPFGVR